MRELKGNCWYKLVALFLVLAVIAPLLCACPGPETPTTVTPTEPSTVTSTQPAVTPTTIPTAQPILSATQQVRIMAYNTRCIVPTMDEGLLNKILDIGGKISAWCLSDVVGVLMNASVELGLAVANVLLDYKTAVEERTKQRASLICNEILNQPDIDIIVFNEVFSEEAREILFNRLYPEFPSVIEKVGSDSKCSEDSGLMLFARADFVFQSLPKALEKYRADQVTACKGASWIPFDDVAFVEYEDSTCEDGLANKGVAYVRILNTRASPPQPLNVVFTHTQADPTFCLPGQDTDPKSTRKSQMAVIASMVKEAIAGNDEAVFVLGDLNIKGAQEGAIKDWNKAHSDLSIDPNAASTEWADYFGKNTNTYFSQTLQDTWAYTTSPSDPGLTTGSTRYDYLLMRRQYQDGLATQHITTRFNNNVSDHRAIYAVINQYEPHCMPAEAIQLQQPDPEQWQNPVQPIDGKIVQPGGMNWYRFVLPGTYSFGVNPVVDPGTPSIDIKVYEHTDLSFDISNYYGEQTDMAEFFRTASGAPMNAPVGKKFVIPQAPFYVRIAAATPDWSGRYGLFIRRHEGTTKNDAISLPANCTRQYIAPTTKINDDDMPWFHLRTETALSQRPQTLCFIVMWDANLGQDPFTLELLDNNNNELVTSTDVHGSAASINNNYPAYGETCPVFYTEILPDDLDSYGNSFYLRVKRPQAGQYPTYFMRWETNLQVLHGYIKEGQCGFELFPKDETCVDGLGSDEIGVDFWADEIWHTYYSPDQLGATDVDSNDLPIPLGLMGPLWYMEKVQAMIREVDSISDDYSIRILIGTLPPEKDHLWNQQMAVSVPCSGTGDPGTYMWRCNVSRNLQVGTCSNDRICP